MGTTDSKCAGTLLWKACKNGDAQKIKSIIDHPDAYRILDWKHPTSGTTPLMEACRYGRVDAVEKLIAKETPIDSTDSGEHGNTALHYAAYYNQASCLRVLLDKAADPFRWNKKGHSAIDLARFRQKSEVERLLSYENTLYSSWVYVQKPESLLPQWKRRYARLLRTSLTNSSYELALYRNPNDTRPTHVLVYTPRELVALPIEHKQQKWFGREFMFGFAQPVLFQHPFPNEFSRNEAIRKALEKGSKEPTVVHFAADDEKALRQWLMVLNDPPWSSGGNRKTQDYEELFPPPSATRTRDNPLFSTTEPTAAQSPPALDCRGPETTVFCAMCGRVGVRSIDCPHCVSRLTAPAASAPPIEMMLNNDIPPPSYSQATANKAVASPLPPPPQMRSSTPNLQQNTATECVVCMDAKRDAVCVPCGHIAACMACLEEMKSSGSGCPICRGQVQSVVKIYHA